MNRRQSKRCPALRRGRVRAWQCLVVLGSLLIPVQASGIESAVVRSLLIPGLGQAHKGHYTRASILAGATVLSGFGILVSQVAYNETVDKYDNARGLYASYEETLASGGVVSIVDLENTYANMQSEHDTADKRLMWRNVFLTAFIATYAINIVDVLISKPYEADAGQTLRLEVGPGNLRVTKTFRF
jgi:hypothetical protein